MAFVQTNGNAALLLDGHRFYLACRNYEIALQTEIEVCGHSAGREGVSFNRTSEVGGSSREAESLCEGMR